MSSECSYWLEMNHNRPPPQGLGIVVEQEMSPPLSDWLSAFLDMGTVIPSVHQPVTLRKSSLLLRSDFILPTLPT